MIIRKTVNSLLFMEEIKDLRQSLTQITLKNWIEIKKIDLSSTQYRGGTRRQYWNLADLSASLANDLGQLNLSFPDTWG